MITPREVILDAWERYKRLKHTTPITNNRCVMRAPASDKTVSFRREFGTVNGVYQWRIVGSYEETDFTVDYGPKT